MISLDNLKKVHFIGIASPFSSFCAEYLISKGVKVTASEVNQTSDNAKNWLNKGVLYKGGHNAKYITKDIDLVVYPNAPIPENPECEKAEKLQLATIAVPKLVGEIGKNLNTIAIAGTHGKTTTTSLTIWLIKQLDKEPTFIVSDAEDKIFGIDKNYNFNKSSKYLVLEACEYKKQFLDRAPKPFISIVTNIDIDHTDYYHTQKSYNNAFVEFLQNTQNFVVINPNRTNEKKVAYQLKKKEIVDYSKYLNIAKKVKNPVLPGKHNEENLACVIALGIKLGFDKGKIIKALKKFKGVSRRFEYIGKSKNGNIFYRDYAHNPTKLNALINALKITHPGKKVILIFQPHSLERSATQKNEFKKVLKRADEVYIPNITIPNREKGLYKNLINAESFSKFVGAKYTKTVENMENVINKLDKNNKDLVIAFASAGDLHRNLSKKYEFKS